MRLFKHLFFSALVFTLFFAWPASAETGRVVTSPGLSVTRVEYNLSLFSNPGRYREVGEIYWTIDVRSADASEIHGILNVIAGDSPEYFPDLNALTAQKVDEFRALLTEHPGVENPTLSNGISYTTDNIVFYPNRKYYQCIVAYDESINRIGYALVEADIPEAISSTESSSQTESPGQTTTPAQTSTPGQTSTSGQTTTPVQTTTPGQTTTPVQTTTPGKTTAPVQTTTPGKTTAPVQTTTPGKTGPQTVTPGSGNEQPAITIQTSPSHIRTTAKKHKIIVSWKKIKNKALSGKVSTIQIQCATDRNFTQNVSGRRVGKKKTRATLNLKDKTTYYVRVRYVGTDGFSAWSKVKRVRTK